MIMKVKNIDYIRVVATTPEKTHNQKFLTFETILNRFLVQFYPGFKKKEKKLPPLIYTVQVQYDHDHDDHDDDHDHPTL